MGDRGFTLIEVLVAMTITGVVLGLVIALFGGGLQTVKAAESHSRALMLAREKVDEALTRVEFPGEEKGGSAGEFNWRRTVSPFSPDGDHDELSGTGLYRVDVLVSWKEGERTRDLKLAGLTTGEYADE